MKKYVRGSEIPEDAQGPDSNILKEAASECIEYPLSKKLFGKLMNLESDSVLPWLKGALECAEILQRGDVEGISQIYNVMLQDGVDAVLDILRNIK